MCNLEAACSQVELLHCKRYWSGAIGNVAGRLILHSISSLRLAQEAQACGVLHRVGRFQGILLPRLSKALSCDEALSVGYFNARYGDFQGPRRKAWVLASGGCRVAGYKRSY